MTYLNAESDTDLNGVVTAKSTKAGYLVIVTIGGHDVTMQLDTGAAVSIIPEATYKSHLSKYTLTETKPLKSYSRDKLELLGQIRVPVKYESQTVTLPLVVAKGNKVPLLGRNWLEHIKLNWTEIFALQQSNPVNDLIFRYAKLFEDSEGKITSTKAHITLKEQAQPVFQKARPVPYTLKKPLEDTLDELEREGVLIKADHSSWESPVVLVPKPDKSIRMCEDYKVSINPWVKTDGYPLPTVQDLFATLAGGKFFSKIDLKQAYQQLEVGESSQEFLTINTHKGLY